MPESALMIPAGEASPFTRELPEGLIARFLFSGVSYGEFAAATARWRESGDWYDAWLAGGQRLAARAVAAEADGRSTLAGRCWLQAAALFHFSQFHLFSDTLRKRQAQDLTVSCYARARSWLVPRCQRFNFVSDRVCYPGYLRETDAGPNGAYVILVNGLDSVKEVELHYWSEVFLQAGLSTLVFDGPGQGPVWRDQALCVDYDAVIRAAVCALEEERGANPSHIGLFGISFGGHLVSRAAALLPRLGAAVDLGGPFDFSFLATARPALQQNFCYAYAAPDVESLLSRVDPAGLDAVPPPACPLLIVHGRRDASIPAEHAARTWAWAPNAELHLFADGDHVCTNRFTEVTSLVTDWLAPRLGTDPFAFDVAARVSNGVGDTTDCANPSRAFLGAVDHWRAHTDEPAGGWTVAEHSIVVPTTPEQALAIADDLERWPEMFEPCQSIEILERAGQRTRFRLTARVNDALVSWVSERIVYPFSKRVEFVQLEPFSPLLAMHGSWDFVSTPGGTLLRFIHRFLIDPAQFSGPRDPRFVEAESAICRALDANSTAELLAVARACAAQKSMQQAAKESAHV